MSSGTTSFSLVALIVVDAPVVEYVEDAEDVEVKACVLSASLLRLCEGKLPKRYK